MGSARLGLCALLSTLALGVPHVAAAQGRTCGAFGSSAPIPWTLAMSQATSVEWCVTNETTASVALLELRVYVDAQSVTPLPPQIVAPTSIACSPDVGGLACRAPLPPAVRDRLAVPGSHTIELTLAKPGSLESISSGSLAVETPATQCLYTDPVTGLQWNVPIGTVKMSRSNKSTVNFAPFVELLERAGFRVEPYRAQWAADTGSGATFVSNGFWWYRARCVGVQP